MYIEPAFATKSGEKHGMCAFFRGTTYAILKTSRYARNNPHSCVFVARAGGGKR